MILTSNTAVTNLNVHSEGTCRHHHSPASSTNSHGKASSELCFYGHAAQAHMKPISRDKGSGFQQHPENTLSLLTGNFKDKIQWRQEQHNFYLGNVGLGPKPHRKGNAPFFCVHVFHTHKHTKISNPMTLRYLVFLSSLKQQKSHQIRQKYFET